MISETQQEIRQEIIKIKEQMPCELHYIALQCNLSFGTILKLIKNEKVLAPSSLRAMRNFIKWYKQEYGK